MTVQEDIAKKLREQEAARARFFSNCPACMKIRATCPVCAGVI